MWSHLNKRLTTLKRVAGVSLWITHEGYEASAIVLKQENGVVKIEKELNAVHFDDLLVELSEYKLPVALHIDGRGILHRSVEKNADQSEQELINIVMPNAKAAEFNIQSYDDHEKKQISIIRKDLLQTMLDGFVAKTIDVIQVYMGPLVSSRICLATADPCNTLNVKGWSLAFNEGQLVQIQQLVASAIDQKDLTLKGGEQLAARAIVPYAVALSCMIYRNDAEFTFYSSSIKNLRGDWEQKRLFRQSFKIALAGVFLILFINTIFFVQGNMRNEQLTFEVQSNEKVFSRLESLKQEIARKKKFIAETAWGDFPRAAFYADRLAASVPENVWLTEINIHPMDEKMLKTDRKQLFKNKLIQIKGRSDNPIVINDWIKKLGDLDWIQKITNQEFEYSAHERTGIFSFHIQIK
jgi:Tfp pilus assembly protein PilN